MSLVKTAARQSIRAAFAFTLISAMTGFAAVTIRDSTFSWRTYSYQMNANNTLASHNFGSKISTTYPVKIIENEYLIVKVLWGFGGRILSMIYKPTGHEQLYQDPVGVPYGINEGSFYYQWLMILGGIFPTPVEPEHGKYWCVPWTMSVVKNTADTVSVSLAMCDTINYPGKPPARFKYVKTGLGCIFTVSVIAGRSAIETHVALTNDSAKTMSCEYWTNTGLAPGSVPGNSRTTAGAEIVTALDKVHIESAWSAIASQEKSLGNNLYQFKNLRWFKNWVYMGIAYASPQMQCNFWGVINHDNEEGIFRISPNVKTPGLKIWIFGYSQSVNLNPETNSDFPRPFVELWGGASNEFFIPANFAAHTTTSFDESYITTVGMPGVTHAGRDLTVLLTTDTTSYNGAIKDSVKITCAFTSATPADPVRVRLQFEKADSTATLAVCDTTISPDAVHGNLFTRIVPVGQVCGATSRLSGMFLTPGGRVLLSAPVPLTFTNLQSCASAIRAAPVNKHLLVDRNMRVSVYSIDGRLVCRAPLSALNVTVLPKGIYAISSRSGCVRRMVIY